MAFLYDSINPVGIGTRRLSPNLESGLPPLSASLHPVPGLLLPHTRPFRLPPRLSKELVRTECGGSRSVVGGYDWDDPCCSQGRLTKPSSMRAYRSAGLDRYWVERRDFGGDRMPLWRASEGRPESIISARDGERSANRLGYCM